MYDKNKLRQLAENISKVNRLGPAAARIIEELSSIGEMWDIETVRGNIYPDIKLLGVSISVSYAAYTHSTRFWVNMFENGDAIDSSRTNISDTATLDQIEKEILEHTKILEERNKK